MVSVCFTRALANLGFLFQITGLLIVLPIGIALYLNESQVLVSLLMTCVAFLGSGFLMNAFSQRKGLDFRGSCILVCASFVLLPLLGAIPYVYLNAFNDTNPLERITNAYFESVSGFTTTGFSFVANPDSLPASLILYRSLTELMGGVGIVFLLLAFLYRSRSLENIREALGIERITGNVKKIFLLIMVIYGAYIAVGAVVFYFSGFQNLIKSSSFFIDTITGGFAPSSQTLQLYLAPAIQLTIIAVMIAGSVNFGLHHQLFRRKLKGALTLEIKFYLLLIALGTILLVFLSGITPLASLFHVVSMSSSTGLDYINVSKLEITPRSIFIILMLLGGCGFSMAGGIRIYRLVTFYRAIKEGIRKVTSRLKGVQYENKGPKKEEITAVSLSTLLFFATLVVFSFAFSTIGVSLIDALFEVGSALTTNGISTGITTLLMPSSYKWLLIAAMLLGRIELITVISAFRPEKIEDKKSASEKSATTNWAGEAKTKKMKRKTNHRPANSAQS